MTLNVATCVVTIGMTWATKYSAHDPAFQLESNRPSAYATIVPNIMLPATAMTRMIAILRKPSPSLPMSKHLSKIIEVQEVCPAKQDRTDNTRSVS